MPILCYSKLTRPRSPSPSCCRSYFRCVCSRTHAPCPARKRIDRVVGGPPGEPPLSVSFINRHNHTLARQAGAEGDGRCSSCVEAGAAARPDCWCQRAGGTLQRWGLETLSAQELAQEMCSDLVSQMPSPGAPGSFPSTPSLRRHPPALVLPLDVSGTPESTPSSGPGLCWVGDPDEHWDLVSPDADALGATLSVPLRLCDDLPSPPAASQEGQPLSLRAFGEERRVRSQDFEWATRGRVDRPWELYSGRRSGPTMGMLFDKEGEEVGTAGDCTCWPAEACRLGCTTICRKRKKTTEDVPAILAKLRRTLDARKGKGSSPASSGVVAESNVESQGQGELELEGAEGPSASGEPEGDDILLELEDLKKEIPWQTPEEEGEGEPRAEETNERGEPCGMMDHLFWEGSPTPWGRSMQDMGAILV